MRRHLVTAILAIACVAGLVAVGTAGEEADNAPVSHIERVAVASVEPAPASRAHTFHGVLRPADRALVAFPLGGRVVTRAVDVGDVIAAGDPIATLDDAPYRNQIDAARATIQEIDARLEQLERESARAEQLVAAQIGNQQTLDQLASDRAALQASRRAASAQLSEARRQLGETTLEAPIGGTVSDVLVQPGEVVGPGSPIVAVAGVADVEVEFDVPEAVFSHLSEGQRVALTLPLSDGRRVEATITAVSRSAAGRGRLFPVVARVDADADVAPGMAARIIVDVPEAPAVMVPLTAVIDPTGRAPHVLNVRDGVVHAVSVDAHGLRGGNVRVDGALSPGDLVVVTGHGRLSEGDPVEVALQQPATGEAVR